MKRILFSLFLSVISFYSFAQQANNSCTNTTDLTPQTTCGATTNESLQNTTATGSPTHVAGTTNDLWYKFTTPAGITSVVITLSGPGQYVQSNAYIQAFSGGVCNSGTFTGTSLGTSAGTTASGTSLSLSSLTGSTQYFFRVFTITTNTGTTPANRWDFDICVSYTALPPAPTISGPKPTRMKEVFQETILANNAAGLDSPWEITYEDKEDSLWMTENKTYKIRKMSPSTGQSRVILDLSQTGSFSSFRRTFTSSQNPWPQGGMMGFAIHPQFLAASNPKNFVYVAYVRAFVGAGPAGGTRATATNPSNGEAVKGDLFTTFVVRFDYNTTTKALENPVALCDTITGSNDHNSGRLAIAPVDGTDYLFYSVGDMGAGQFYSAERTIKSEMTNSYEGKILRFSLEKDLTEPGLDGWIPDDNPYSNIAPVTGKSAVWSIGHRNVQGLAYANNMLFGSSHGPFSDDELNVLTKGKHHGHPRIVGYKDGNYNNARAATASFNGWSNEFSGSPLISSLPLITDEANITIANFQPPIFSFFDAPNGSSGTSGTVLNLYTNNPSNSGWPSIAPSGMGAYTDTKIPGWKNSLIMASLKRGYMMRVKPNTAGTDVEDIGGADTAAIFNTQNRFRDMAFDPDGWSIYGAIDRSGSTSGPTSTTPVSSTCAGCIIKYTFLGYNHSGGTSTIPTSIAIDGGTLNNCVTGTSVTINPTSLNSNIWVPLTGPDGNIVAEINANGNDLGNVTSSFYTRSGSPVRSTAGNTKYLNRNVTISVQNQPTSNVSVRLYLTTSELTDMITATSGSVSGINDIGIFKNNDGCGSTLTAATTPQTITGRYAHGSFGHAIQADISSFSTFYFMSSSSSLPANVITFKAVAVGDASKLQWTVDAQENVEKYIIERSINNISFNTIGTVAARGSANEKIDYLFTDINAAAIATTVYYRIKIQDKDGSHKYTSVVPVTFERFADAFVTVQPNPVVNNASFMIYTNTDETAQLRIVDNTGRTVITRTIQLTTGKNTVELNVSSLQSGLYYVDVTGKTINQKTKLIKQ